MRQYRTYITSIILFFTTLTVWAQQESYKVELSPFCSPKFDEFSPIFYKNTLVFVSNSNHGFVVDYKTYDNENTYKIFSVTDPNIDTWKSIELLSKDLFTGYNDGPASFSKEGDLVYFSSNIPSSDKKKDNTQRKSRLGLFYSEFSNGRWGAIKAFRFNDNYHSVTMPSLSKDGKRLFFVSDMLDGMGGTDIYYCDWKDGYWDKPVNLGPNVNTAHNESYPYVNDDGGLFFSSDGHKGLGGKDIFYTEYSNGNWITPIPLDAPINSADDDFGLVCDSEMNGGYFSSNRNGKSVDIFKFSTINHQYFNSIEQEENNYLFRFVDDGSIPFDTTFIDVIWTFNDSITVAGKDVSYLFPGQGVHSVQETLVDKMGNLIMVKKEFTIDIRNIEQPYITGKKLSTPNEAMSFSGSLSNMPDYEIIDYLWDMGDGSKYTGEESVNHTYTKEGTYIVRLGLLIKNTETGTTRRPSTFIEVVVGDASSETIDKISIDDIPMPEESSQVTVTNTYSVANIINDSHLFHVVVAYSEAKVKTDGIFFSPLLTKYYVRERFDAQEKIYKYFVSEDYSFLDAFKVFEDIIDMRGFATHIEPVKIEESAARELYNIKKVYDNASFLYFQENKNSFVPGGLIFLNQIATFLKKHSTARILIECRTNEMSSVDQNIALAQSRAIALANYLTENGIDKSRMVVKGFYSDKIATDRSIQNDNNRVDIFLLSIN